MLLQRLDLAFCQLEHSLYVLTDLVDLRWVFQCFGSDVSIQKRFYLLVGVGIYLPEVLV